MTVKSHRQRNSCFELRQSGRQGRSAGTRSLAGQVSKLISQHANVQSCRRRKAIPLSSGSPLLIASLLIVRDQSRTHAHEKVCCATFSAPSRPSNGFSVHAWRCAIGGQATRLLGTVYWGSVQLSAFVFRLDPGRRRFGVLAASSGCPRASSGR
jgi:hypothetical protein